MPFKFKNTPPQPYIDEISQVGSEVTVKLYAEDPEDDSVSLKVDFGDGYVTQWSEFVRSGYIIEFTHQYSSSGNYTMKIQAKDEYGAESEFEYNYLVGWWAKTDLGLCYYFMFNVAVGDGQGDDKPRVYAACGHICELEWTESGWVKRDLVDLSQWYEEEPYIRDVTVEDGRGIYATSDEHVYKFGYSGEPFYPWSYTLVGSGNSWMEDVAVGDGRGDGKPRVYAACGDNHVYEFEWTDSGWVKTDLGSGGSDMEDVAVGDGRGDGKPRVYAACNDYHIYEFEWNGSSWIKTDLGSGGIMLGIALGDGRGDGKPRVYAACEDNHVYEFEWDGSSWVKRDLGSGGGDMLGVAVGDGRGDDKPRVYVACADGHVYEFEWNGSSWIKTDLGSGGSCMNGVAVGDGRGDGKPRVYVACGDNHVYEFEWK